MSPLLFSLYLNDLEDFLLEKGSNYIKTNSEVCDSYLKILLLLYADDTVIMSNSAENLQKALTDLECYCTQWKLQINCSKTKIIIFGKRKSSPDKFNFTYSGNKIEIVDEFKYLGVLFRYNGNFLSCKRMLKDQASKAMFSVISKIRQLGGLTMDTQLDLFDKLVIPVLTYGCEVWGYSNNNICEVLHLKFCKYILILKQTTPSCMVYGELGRTPPP